MFAIQNVLKLATDAFGLTPVTSGPHVSIERVEFKTVDVNTSRLTGLDDDGDFIFVNNPSPYRLGKIADLQTRTKAAFMYLNSCPSDTTAKNAFLLLAGYENPDIISHDEAKTIAEACLQELSCQSIKRRSDLESDTTNGLTKVSFIDHDPLAGLLLDENYFKLI